VPGYSAYGPVSEPIPVDSGISDIYVYDGNGHLVPNARLFDQNGNLLQLGSPYCQDGNPAPGVGSPDVNGNITSWTYPLCPNDQGPFRAGPGALTTPGPSARPSPATSATPSPASSGPR
jgi:hypothetical protein